MSLSMAGSLEKIKSKTTATTTTTTPTATSVRAIAQQEIKTKIEWMRQMALVRLSASHSCDPHLKVERRNGKEEKKNHEKQ